MAERLGARPRPIGMRTQLLGLLLLAGALAGCGDSGSHDPSTDASVQTSAGPTVAAACAKASGTSLAVDLDGDGTADSVEVVDTAACPHTLVARVGEVTRSAELSGDLPVVAADLSALDLSGRTGQVLLVVQRHPRGGFQARLFGYADGRFEELRAEGKPIMDFVATDVQSTPTSAECLSGGFAVTQARAHEPIGVAPAWDVFRTTYAVDGNRVTRGETTQVAENVLDRRLQRDYGNLVSYDLFENCRAGR